MRFIAALIISVFSVASYAQGQFESGNKLKKECDAADSIFSRGYCAGYVIGVADSRAMAICAPSGVTIGQSVSIVRKYLNDNPALLHIDADVLVLNSLQQAFPCPKK